MTNSERMAWFAFGLIAGANILGLVPLHKRHGPKSERRLATRTFERHKLDSFQSGLGGHFDESVQVTQLER